jgi:hypothetical protein
MKLHGSITINDRHYSAGDNVSWISVYPFFLVHMLGFGVGGFIMAYGTMDDGTRVPLLAQCLFGGFAISVYTVFYLLIFGRDDVKWMFINAGLGLFGILSQIDWLLSLFGKRVADFPVYVHVVPFLYFVLYTFLIRHALLDLLGAREDETKRARVEYGYVGASVFVYLLLHFLEA